MVTQEDLVQIAANIQGLYPKGVHSALLVGCRDEKQKAILERQTQCYIHTLDIDEGLDPTIVYDLDSDEEIPGEKYELIVCSNTLMYVPRPYVAIKRLLEATKRSLLISEPYVRNRAPETTLTKDARMTYTDRNRFYPNEKDYMENPIKKKGYEAFFLSDLPATNIASYTTYDNPAPHVQLLWHYAVQPTAAKASTRF